MIDGIKSLSILALFIGVLFTYLMSQPSQQALGNEYPEKVNSHLNQGIKLMRQNQLDSAKIEFESAIKLEQECPEAYNNLGLCYLKEGQLNKAKVEFGQALQIDSNYLPSLNNMGAVLYRQHNYSQATFFYKKALSSP